MSRILLVARREFITNLKRRSFLFTAFGLPLLIIGVQFAIGYFVGRQSRSTGTLGEIGYIDQTPDQVLRQGVDKPEEYQAFPDHDAARSALLAGQIGAYFVVPDDFLERGIIHAYGIKDVPRGIEQQMAAFLTDNLLSEWPPERAARLKEPANLTISTLDEEKVIKDDDSAFIAVLMPIIFGMLFMMSIFTTSGYLLQGVVEEKENRLIEILVTSITPFQMLWGKILGLGMLGLLQVLVWTAAGGLVISQGTTLWSGLENVNIPTPVLVWGPVYLLFGYLLYGALLAGIGASVASIQEGQQISGILGFIAASPIVLAVTFFENANGPVPLTLSLVPFTAPIAMIMRLPYTDVPLWQITLSLMLLVLATMLVVWLAAQVFRVGLLMYGKRLGPRTLWSVLRQGMDIVPEQSKEHSP